MTKSQHTPGPWTVHQNYTLAHYVVFDRDGNYGDTSVETIDANARLIACAPEMLEALQNLSAQYPGERGLDLAMRHGLDALLLEVRALIAKARGE